MSKSTRNIVSEIEALAPWHHTIELGGGISTQSAKSSANGILQYDPSKLFFSVIDKIFPDGLAGRSFLDCGCNAGGVALAAHERGAGRIYGFDARSNWIEQASLVLRHKTNAPQNILLEHASLSELETHDAEYDVTWFGNLFQHLATPVEGLKFAADRTREVLVLTTACAAYDAREPESPNIELVVEKSSHPLSGIDGFGSLPSGPEVIEGILSWLGFVDIRVVRWRHLTPKQSEGKSEAPPRGRLVIVAAKQSGLLRNLPNLTHPTDRACEAGSEPRPRQFSNGGRRGRAENPPLGWQDTSPFETTEAPAAWDQTRLADIEPQKLPNILKTLDLKAASSRDTAAIPTPKDKEKHDEDSDLQYWLSGLRDYTLISRQLEALNHSTKRLLDIGCSSGRILRHFAFQSDVPELWGVDEQHRQVRFVNTHLPPSTRAIAVQDIPSLPLEDNYFDVITALSNGSRLEPLETAFLAELRRVLRPGGIVFLTVDESRLKKEPLCEETEELGLLSQSRGVHHPSLSNQIWGRIFSKAEFLPTENTEQSLLILQK
ncbi:methyltransferase family protein [Shimia isoporae]|uniref:Methyltransferase family protein n=1 Tax=Shimia isoporae TaxID=647720 RepID=A0A4R1NUW5_9RHOB|nr:methyltransferase domain-containing protein [Shimia isoporae]TCL09048.1 methyltransferase family protein [Shimia isoporae]